MIGQAPSTRFHRAAITALWVRAVEANVRSSAASACSIDRAPRRRAVVLHPHGQPCRIGGAAHLHRQLVARGGDRSGDFAGVQHRDGVVTTLAVLVQRVDHQVVDAGRRQRRHDAVAVDGCVFDGQGVAQRRVVGVFAGCRAARGALGCGAGRGLEGGHIDGPPGTSATVKDAVHEAAMEAEQSGPIARRRGHQVAGTVRRCTQ